MHLHTRNVNTAFRELVGTFAGLRGLPGVCTDIPIVRTPSRNGSVLKIDEPVTITYSHPKERVLFNAARDVNPFALLYESLWMLAGRNDVDSLAYYTKRFRDFSDDGKTLNGAYGYRWRNHVIVGDDDRIVPGDYSTTYTTVDQLQILINHLKADPNSRRAVLQMWNVEDDLLKIGVPNPAYKMDGSAKYREEISGLPVFPPDTSGREGSKDVCCNLNVMFSIRTIEPSIEDIQEAAVSPNTCDITTRKYLDMTVTNRSNDLIWGMLGANYVTFSILQEYMAAHLGVEVGRYHHISNNLHVYDDPGNPKVAPWTPEKWLSDHEEGWDYTSMGTLSYAGRTFPENKTQTTPLVKDPAVFDREVVEFVEKYSGKRAMGTNKDMWKEPFLRDVADPIMMAYQEYKYSKNVERFLVADEWARSIKADDWRLICTNWLERRKNNAQGPQV